MHSEKRLVQPVHFVAPADRIWPELKSEVCVEISPNRLAELYVSSLDPWVLLTYYRLRMAGEGVTLSDQVRRDAINVADVYELGRRNRGLQAFFLVPRADGHEPELANYTVTQNGIVGSHIPYSTIPHWIQPGIIKRNGLRGSDIETLSYKGAVINLDHGFRSPEFLAQLKMSGVRLEVAAEPHKWGDYREVDLVLAIRNLTAYDAARKPASKLVNAWWAEVPALLGPEPAFSEVGRPGQDYIEVRRPSDVLDAIAHLRADPNKFQSIIKEGRRKRELFRDSFVVDRWIDILNGPVAAEFSRWRNCNPVKRAVTVMKKMVKNSASLAKHQQSFFSGKRILDD